MLEELVKEFGEENKDIIIYVIESLKKNPKPITEWEYVKFLIGERNGTLRP
jgi:hypothetical protein